jgi:hypothetical protein
MNGIYTPHLYVTCVHRVCTSHVYTPCIYHVCTLCVYVDVLQSKKPTNCVHMELTVYPSSRNISYDDMVYVPIKFVSK